MALIWEQHPTWVQPFAVSIQHSNMPHILTHTTWTLQDHKERISGENSFCIFEFCYSGKQAWGLWTCVPRVQCNALFTRPGRLGVPRVSVPRVYHGSVLKEFQNAFSRVLRDPQHAGRASNGSHTLHLGYQLLSPCFTLQGQEISARSISTHTSNNGLYTITWMKYSLQSTSNSVKPSFDLFNIMAMLQWPPIGPIKGNECVWLVVHNE